ncbi:MULTISPECIES: PTS sugar transporter subunit IIC [Clostridium]|uniref:PTS sugar transporter subunit IIC n=1 Tax=Clostridium TaxID=1485 RepID=UPI001C8BF339|nr:MULTISPECIES: PTS transporter subunit EIIC [Clostridium]MBX9184170.1 PTS sugar transporter subunit IIC [Clostridium sp. K04]
MEKFMAFMDKYITPYAAKMGAQRHLVAVRDAFVAMIPLTIIGSLATLINNAPIKALSNFLADNTFGQQIKSLNGDIWFGTLAIMALLLVIGVAYNLAKSYEENGLQSAMIATSIFILLIPQVAKIAIDGQPAVEGWGFIGVAYLGTGALFTAIIIGILSTEVFIRLGKLKQLVVKMPEGVPPAVSRSFAKLIPGMLTVVIFAVAGLLIRLAVDGQFLTDLINKYLGIPLSNITDTLPSAILIAFFIHGLWFVGLHGANIALPFTGTMLTNLGAQNAEMIQNGAPLDQLHVLAGPFFDAFVFMGGSGVIIGLLIAIAIAGKRRRDMLALGLAPSIFNISEPVIFGLPIVLNPIFGIPFVIAPIVTTIISYLSISFGLVHPIIMATMPWTTPPILGGFMATGHWSGAVLCIVNIAVSILIYLPFVAMAEKMDARKMEMDQVA